MIYAFMDPFMLWMTAMCMSVLFMGAARLLLWVTAPTLKQSGHVKEIYGLFLMLELACFLTLSGGLILLFYGLLPSEISSRIVLGGVQWTFTAVFFLFGLLLFLLWLPGVWNEIKKQKRKDELVKKIGMSCDIVADTQIPAQYHAIGEKLGLRKLPILQTNDGWTDAYIYGISNPAIVIPFGFYPAKACQISMCHELIHYKRKHIIVRKLTSILNIIFWFIPGQVYLMAEIKELQETLCDLEACKVLKEELTTAEYYETILQVSLLKRKVPVDAILASLIEDYGRLSRRACNMDYIQHGRRRRGLLFTTAFLLMLLFLTNTVAYLTPKTSINLPGNLESIQLASELHEDSPIE